MTTDRDQLVIIDGNSLVYRAFFALPLLTNSSGQPTNAIYGFLQMLFRLLEDEDPRYLCVVFDRSEPTFRHEKYPEYKATRDKTPDELGPQFDLVREALDALQVPVITLAGYEADDLAGTLARRAAADDCEVLVVTGDRDLLQVVGPHVRVRLTKRGITETEDYDLEAFRDRYGIEPEQFVDVKALMGDQSDNIPGIYGVGEKTALKFIKQFGSLEDTLANTDQISGPKTRQRVAEGSDDARLSKDLATIRCDAPVDWDLAACERQEPRTAALRELFVELEFNQFLERFDMQPGETGPKLELELEVAGLRLVTAGDQDGWQAMVQAGNEAGQTVFVPANRLSGDETVGDLLAAWKQPDGGWQLFILSNLLSGAGDELVIQDPWREAPLYQLAANLAKDEVVTYDGKAVLAALAREHHKLPVAVEDLQVASYLLDPANDDQPLTDWVEERFQGAAPEFTPLDPESQQLETQAAGDGAKEHPAVQALATILAGWEWVHTELTAQDLWNLYESIEGPLIPVLARMEAVGIRVNEATLQELSREFRQRMEELEEQIYQLAGEEFNINSPQQLGEILFEKLDYPVLKRTKTGYSTAASVLEELSSEHDCELADCVLEYRSVAKLESTYIAGLSEHLRDDGRIHTTFRQTIAATGRLSSADPNLQNIPVRDELGRRIRKAFVAGAGRQLVAADYSQVELRVLAQLSGDERLIAAFQDGADIHTRTAAEVFSVPEDEVTRDLRSRAKAVNFGIVYGISAYGLARNLDVSQSEAQEYIDLYLQRYPGVKAYQEQMIEQAREEGFVRTLFGRIRYLPEIRSRNWHRRSFAERTAINTPVQGSAADLIKLAMVKLARHLANEDETQLLLQVHDELILETPAAQVQPMAQLLQDEMEKVLEGTAFAGQFRVPLVVDVKVGADWYNMDAYDAGQAALEG